MTIKWSKKMVYHEVLDYIMIAVGMLSYAVGWMLFMLPNHIPNGGVAGLASIIYWGTGFPVSLTYFMVNFVLLVAALKVLGLKFCIKSIFGVLMLTFFTSLMRTIAPHPTILSDQPFMTTIIGAVFCGIGLGFGLSYNGSSGGSDIVAAMVNKYHDISLGRVILLCDVIIVTLSITVLKDWEQVIYGYVNLIITSFVLDQVVNSGRRSVQFFIISNKYEEICARVVAGPPHRGCTLMDAQGYYSGNPVKVIIIVTRQREAGYIYRMINSIDENAFVTQSQVMGVFGKGFDKIKGKRKVIQVG